MAHGLEQGFILDRQWRWMRGQMETTKKPALLALGRILNTAGSRYALIGGVALQAHVNEPRTTIDIDVAIATAEELPRRALQAAGFEPTGTFAHSENWRAADGTPVQFTFDPALAGPIARAEELRLAEVVLRVIRRADLLREKLRAAADPERRRSKRLQDLADAQALLEAEPKLEESLTPSERALFDRLSP